MSKAAKRQGYSYRVTDLDYPAVSVNAPLNALGAKISSGKAFAFGRSVKSGVSSLKNYYRNTAKKCAETKWVLGGYSQGAMVVAQAVEGFNASKVVYVGLFGDPWTYLPEGKGAVPRACFGRNLSNYRVYAPTCRTYKGSLGARDPYVAIGLSGKVGLWCNKDDYICGSSRRLLNNSGHTKYAEKNEFIWMADIVERKLVSRRDDNGVVVASVVGGNEVNNAILASAVGDDEVNNAMPASAAEDEEDEADVVEDVIEAHFSADEYNSALHGDVTFDASGSFSFGHEIIEYL